MIYVIVIISYFTGYFLGYYYEHRTRKREIGEVQKDLQSLKERNDKAVSTLQSIIKDYEVLKADYIKLADAYKDSMTELENL